MHEDLGKSLVETISKAELPATISDYGEIAFDSLLDDGIVKEIPIIKTIASLIKTGIAVKDYYFIKRLARFISSVSEMEERDRQKLLAKLDKDTKSAVFVGEMLIELLLRLDNAEKPLLMANALKAYAKDNIDFTQLQRINYAIDRLLMCDIHYLRPFVDSELTLYEEGNPVIVNFINAGLAYTPAGMVVGGRVRPTETGKLFSKYVI